VEEDSLQSLDRWEMGPYLGALSSDWLCARLIAYAGDGLHILPWWDRLS